MNFLVSEYSYEIYVYQDEENKSIWIRLQDLAYILHNTVRRFDVQQDGDFFTVVSGRSIRDRHRDIDYGFLSTPPTNDLHEPVSFQEAYIRNWLINNVANSWLGYHTLDVIQNGNDYFFNLQNMSCFFGFLYSLDYDNNIIIHASISLDEPSPIPPPSTAEISDYGKRVTIEFLQDFLSLFGVGVYLDDGIMFDRNTRIFFTDEFQPPVFLVEIQNQNEDEEGNGNENVEQENTTFLLFNRNNELIATEEVPYYYNGLLATAFWLYYFGNNGIPDIVIYFSTEGWGGEILYRYIDGQFQPMQYIMNPTFYKDSQQRLIVKATDMYYGRYEQYFHITFADDNMDYSYLGTWWGELNHYNNPHPFENEELIQIHSLFELEEYIISYVRSNLGMMDTAVPWLHWSAVTWIEESPPSYTEEGLRVTKCYDCDMVVLSQIIPKFQEEEQKQEEEIEKPEEYEEYNEYEEIEETNNYEETTELQETEEPEEETLAIYLEDSSSSWFSRSAITITLVVILGVILLYQLKK